MARASGQVQALMPDVASHAEVQVAGKLDWVGMNAIELPVFLDGDDGQRVQTNARVNAFVNLNEPDKRGIHMSRLYLHLDRALAEHAVTPAALQDLLRDFLSSHADLSTRAMVRLDFNYLVRRRSLVSDNSGWKQYPISLIATLDGQGFELEMAFQVIYSSTCPCSAALARQLIQQQFAKDFPAGKALDYQAVVDWLGTEEGICATPHSQRSSADVRIKLDDRLAAFPFIEMIDVVEDALKTPVQAAVKREDEQAFAHLNGQNLMFCEDSARRLQIALCGATRVKDFWVRCRHYESLHPHNAVAIVTRGVAGGYKPIDGHPNSWRE